MRKIIILTVLLLPLAVFAQINQVDSSGLRQGKWQKAYPGGNLIYEGMFNDGKPVGEWIRYHDNGQVKARIEYLADSDSAFSQLFDEYGNKIAEGNYVNEKREGNWIFYSGNVKVSEENFQNGLNEGISKTFYPSGELLEKTNWENGIQEGNYEVFFKNGDPYLQCKFSDGKRNGLCLSYFQNGRLEMEAYYKDDMRHGEWKFYSENGKHQYSLNYDQGNLLNPEVRDSISNQYFKEMEKNRQTVLDPEKFMQDPSGYMQQMQKIK